MTPPPDSPVPILLVLGSGVPAEALRSTAGLLEQFGVAHRQVSAESDSQEAAAALTGDGASEGSKIIIAASPDERLPAALAAAGVLVIRVPAAGADPAVQGLALLVPGVPAPMMDTGGRASDQPVPPGAGFATVAIGTAGARNAALLAVAVLAAQGDKRLREAWAQYRQAQTDHVLAELLPE